MRKVKKGLSLLLATTMALSACAVGFTAFADDSKVQAMEDSISKATKWSDELKNQWATLDEGEKDKVNVPSTAKLFSWAWDATKPLGTSEYGKRMKETETLLGEYTGQMKQMFETANYINQYGPVEVIIDGVAVTVENPASHFSFRYTYLADWEGDVKTFNADGTVTTKKATVTAEQQKAVMKNAIDSYRALNARQLQLMEYLNVYASDKVPVTGAYAYFGTSRTLAKSTNNFISCFLPYAKAMAKTGTADATTKQVQDFFISNFPYPAMTGYDMKTSIDKYLPLNDYNNQYKDGTIEDQAFLDKANPLIADANKADSMDKAVTGNSTAYISDGAKYTSFSGILSTAKNNVQNVADKKQVKEFKLYMDSIALPEKPTSEFNAIIAEFQAKYNALTAGSKKIIQADEEMKARISAIYGKGFTDVANDEHQIFEQVKATADLSAIKNALTGTLLPSVDDLLIKALSGLTGNKVDNLNGFVHSYFTNESVTAFAKLVMPMVSELLNGLGELDLSALGQGKMPISDLFGLTPNKLAMEINEDFQETSKELAKYTDWASVPDDLDWGVKDGDYKTFADAFVVTFRSLDSSKSGPIGAMIVQYIFYTAFLDQYTPIVEGGTDVDYSKPYSYGGFEKFFIPLFEAFGATELPTSLEFTKSIRSTVAQDETPRIESYLRPILDIVYKQVLPGLLNDPVDFIGKKLPNVVYHLEDGCIMEGLMSSLNFKLLPELFEMISPDLKEMNFIIKDKLEEFIGTDVTLKGLFSKFVPSDFIISYEDIAGIAKLGTPKTTETKQLSVTSTVQVEADKENVINYLINVIGSKLGIDMNVKGQYVKVQVPAYPHDGKMDKKAINNLINGLEETVGGFINIEDAINGALATNEMAGTAIMGVYNAVNGLVSQLGIQPIAPSRVGKMLGEAKEFKGLTAELKDIATWDEVSFTIKNDDGEVIKQVDMGFKDGDFDGFIKTLVASLRPLVDELQKTGLLTNKTVDGETVYGLYETLIIPMFESIGLKPVATSATYTENFNKLYAKDNNAGLDYLVNTILKPVLTLLEKVEKNPIATIMEVLPNIAYALKYNPTTAFIGNLLLGDKNLADVLGGLISGLAIDAGDNENMAKALTALKEGLKLNPINLDALISCGEIKEVNSMSALNKTYKTVVSDKADTFVTVFYYLFDTINTGDNLKLIKDLLANIEMDAGLKAIVDGLVNSLFDMTREEALCTIGATFSDWTCPNAEDESGANKGTNGKTPGTGDTAVSAIAITAVLFTAGAAIVLLRKKKTIAE